uniref:Uncharacterized protein n=1 Tax=Rhizophora mucronata TaxID=61149 RepID=A0A2P2QYB0_RHIMU
MILYQILSVSVNYFCEA